MTSKQIHLVVFILVAMIQLYVPARMIFNKEDLLKSGTEYKFKLAPIDPSDPFRGKYITLRFADTTIEIQNEEDWAVGETVYISLETDQKGLASIKSVSKQTPLDEQGFLRATIGYLTVDGSNKMTIDYPFDRFYMEESKAPAAELIYRESLQDTTQIIYAVVYIKNGDAALQDVLIDGISISEKVNSEQEF